MITRFYPNLELAQAKSSRRYRVPASKDFDEFVVRDGHASRESSPPRRQHWVPALDSTTSTVATPNTQSIPESDGHDVPGVLGAGDMSSGPRPRSPQRANSPPRPSTRSGPRPSSVFDNAIHGLGTSPVELRGLDATCSKLSVSLARKLEGINHIIARAEGQPLAFSGIQPVAQVEDTGRHVHALLLNETSTMARSSSPDMNNDAGDSDKMRSELPRPSTTPHSQRKIDFLLNQRGKVQVNDEELRGQSQTPTRKSKLSQSPSSRYLISSSSPMDSSLSGDAHTTSLGQLSPVTRQTTSQRHLEARTMDLVDSVNNKPRLGSVITPSVAGLDRQLRRISLVSFDQDSTERMVLRQSDSSSALRRKTVFGIYSIREVMAVIRLFWFLDADRSGGITLDELGRHQRFFAQLGYKDITTVFRELDDDGNGVVTLFELLQLCFRHANEHQLAAMLTLAKVGDIRRYLTGKSALAHTQSNPTQVEDQTRQELRDVFSVFDRNGDGHINLQELLEALQVDEHDLAPAVETARESWAESSRRVEQAMSGGITKEDVQKYYREYDKNNDDVLDFDEFVTLMQTGIDRTTTGDDGTHSTTT